MSGLVTEDRSVIVAAFVPARTEDHLRYLLPRQEWIFARNWSELGLLLKSGRYRTLIIDPSADGSPNTAAAMRILASYRDVYTLAYLDPTPANLSAVLALSRMGLHEVFVYPVSKHDRKFVRAVEGSDARQLGESVLRLIESRVVSLPATVRLVLTDVFLRPHRYHRACDIADEAAVSTRRLYQSLKRAGLPPPKTLLIVAKAVHAYGYLRHSNSSVRSVVRKLGYSDARVLTRHISRVFRRDIDALRRDLTSEDVCYMVSSRPVPSLQPPKLATSLLSWQAAKAARHPGRPPL